MYRKFQPFFIIVETPLHAGSGSELGVIDLPIQREKYTNFPKIESSSLKGAFRELFEEDLKETKDIVNLIFGPENGELHSGSIGFIDARILCFPVKSLKGVFTWITCPMVLNRFVEDLKAIGGKIEFDEELVSNSKLKNTVPNDSDILVSDNKVILEEFTFNVKKDDNTSKIAEKLSEKIFPNDPLFSYWKEKLKNNLLILSDDDFEHFVTMSTEIITRTKIDSNTGTVKSGSLWTEEFLPQDTILYSIAMTTHLRVDDEKKKKGPFNNCDSDCEAEKVLNYFKRKIEKANLINIGGDQTIGKGLVRINFLEMGEKGDEK